MKATRLLLLLCTVSFFVACAPQQETDDAPDKSYLWVRDAAEYRAISRQVYRAASMALPALIADKTWSAMPYQAKAEDLPPAIIMDIDQTLVNGVDFQLGHEPPFTAEKFDDWNDSHVAMPVPGAPEFVKLARASGVRVFFLTNRYCNAGPDGSCTQKPISVQDLNEVGIPATQRKR
jgi:predicted secreted acid phosphatase